jgi:2-dehydro-3-deoxygalactonokinase
MNLDLTNYLLCCDWGTSSFRLRLIRISDKKLVGEVLSQEGIAITYDSWKKQSSHDGISKNQFFQDRLKEHIKGLEFKLSLNLTSIPLIISGMASSSIGMEEVGYSELPFPVDGRNTTVFTFNSREDFPHEILLISGVRSQQDVMRGEETQLIGLVALSSNLIESDKNIFIFPGTHSKHLFIQKDALVAFQTYMTGEIFHLLANHSILKDSIDLSGIDSYSDDNLLGFRQGVQESARSSLLSGAFKVRTNQLFGSQTKIQNAFFLSGLLIGAEVKQLHAKEDWRLILGSGSNLFSLYKLALEELNLLDKTITIPPDIMEQATIAGQIAIFQQQKLLLASSE